MRLIQIPFSHNCIKVRRALELKGLSFETLDISPMDRSPVLECTGQALVPALSDGDAAVAESTDILRYVEEKYPEPSLLPDDPADRAECWLLEDWADRAFMEMSRRLAYTHIIATPDALAGLFFPKLGGLKRRIFTYRAAQVLAKRFRLSPSRNAKDEKEAPRVSRIALDRLAGRPGFFGDRTTVADVALATMAAPMLVAVDHVRNDPAVNELLTWAGPILGDDVLQAYTPPA